jgi:hypothetical protein
MGVLVMNIPSLLSRFQIGGRRSGLRTKEMTGRQLSHASFRLFESPAETGVKGNALFLQDIAMNDGRRYKLK